jgi:hypothetical protein
MRVSRRTRPSQVGCGSTTARRRLLHTQTHHAQPGSTPPDQGAPTQVTVIGFVEARETLGQSSLRVRVAPLLGHASIVSGSKARGW